MKYRRFCALAAFLLFFLSLLIGYGDESANSLLIPVKAGLIVFCASFYFVFCHFAGDEREKRNCGVLSLFILVYEILLFCSVAKTIINIRYYTAILNSLIWIPVSLFFVVRFGRELLDAAARIIKDRDTRLQVISSFVTAAVVIVLSAEPDGIRFTWDSDTLYAFIYEQGFEALFDAKLTTFHSHVSAVYAHILILLKLLAGDVRIAFFVLNSLVILCASFGMTFLLRSLVPEKKNFQYIFSSAVFMFSPWICGMSTYHIYDFYIWCLFPLMICFLAKGNEEGFFVTGVMITFSKASGLVVFGSVCVGILLADIFRMVRKDKKTGMLDILKSVFFEIRYWAYASVAFIFVLIFRSGIASEVQFEDTVFGIDLSHIAHQIKIYTTAGFLWIFFVMTVILFILIMKKKTGLSEEAIRIINILLISDIVFFIFNCLCITYRMPRYMDGHIAVLYICAAVLMLQIDSTKIFLPVTTGLCLISLLGSFRDIDPVSFLLFEDFNVGDHRVVDFEKSTHPGPGDSIICNREYYSYEILLSRALTYVIKNRGENDEIMFSTGDYDINWGFSGGRYSYGYGDGKHYFEMFYDRSIDGLANGYEYGYYSNPEMIPFDMHYIFPSETIESAVSESDAHSFYYLYMPSLNSGKEKEIREDMKVISETGFEFRGWKMNCIRFSR